MMTSRAYPAVAYDAASIIEGWMTAFHAWICAGDYGDQEDLELWTSRLSSAS